MKVLNSVDAIQKIRTSFKKDTSIAFVPTMGALHKGHLSLIKKAQIENDLVIISIFVNPTQFDNKKDLEKYPKTLEKDLKLLKKVACDFVFTPTVKEIYDDKVISKHYKFDGLENEMEGKFRNGHFNGVATIVERLFEIVNPNTAYFGEKDFQQLQIIKKLVEIKKLPIKVIGCKIFREKDGLAMSSRNVRLSKVQRKSAPFIYKILKKAKKKLDIKPIEEIIKWVHKKFKKHQDLNLEYFIIADENTLKETSIKSNNLRAFIAVFAGEIRLIDNIKLK